MKSVRLVYTAMVLLLGLLLSACNVGVSTTVVTPFPTSKAVVAVVTSEPPTLEPTVANTNTAGATAVDLTAIAETDTLLPPNATATPASTGGYSGRDDGRCQRFHLKILHISYSPRVLTL